MVISPLLGRFWLSKLNVSLMTHQGRNGLQTFKNSIKHRLSYETGEYVVVPPHDCQVPQGHERKRRGAIFIHQAIPLEKCSTWNWACSMQSLPFGVELGAGRLAGCHIGYGIGHFFGQCVGWRDGCCINTSGQLNAAIESNQPKHQVAPENLCWTQTIGLSRQTG